MRLRMNYLHNGSMHCFLNMYEMGDSIKLTDSNGAYICNASNGNDLICILNRLCDGKYA